MKKRRAALAILVVLAASACRRQAPGAGGPPPMPVEVVTLTERAVPQTTEYVGTVKSRRSTNVQPQVEGFITAIKVRSGDSVKPGSALMEIDSSLQEAAVASRGYALRIVNADWSVASADKAVTGWLRRKDADGFVPDAVVCQSDNMARGTRRALEVQRPEWVLVPFLGCDGLPGSGRKDVDEGRLDATVALPSCAAPAIELALRWKRDGVVPPAETVLAPSPYPAL